jgi:hypothetical protein
MACQIGTSAPLDGGQITRAEGRVNKGQSGEVPG